MKLIIATVAIALLMGGVGMCGEGVIPEKVYPPLGRIEETAQDKVWYDPETETITDGESYWADSSATIDWTYPAENIVFGEEEFLNISKDGIWTFRFDDETELNLTREQVKGILSIMKRASIILRLTGMWGFGLSDYLGDLELLP